MIGISSDNNQFNAFYVSMMEKLEVRSEELSGNTYLVPKRESKFSRILNAIRNLLWLKNYSGNSENG